GVVPDPGEDPLDTVTERLECRGEQHSVFVAVSASEAGDELGLDAVEVYGDAAAQHQIEVLERDRAHMRPVQGGQGLPGGLEPTGVSDAFQVGGQVEAVDLPFDPSRGVVAYLGERVISRHGVLLARR